ncbi:MAG TPA: hypothetical protein VNK41_12290 [Vicinamibacterales bacterium]|nr:hypothetical protein [Vicinamibacterales bacterium]
MNRAGWIAGALVVAATLALEVAFHDAGHSFYWWHAVPGFDFVYGLVGCAAIVVISKWIGAAGVQRPESYYDDARARGRR